MINNYSPNMLKVFKQCPYEFYFKYVQKIILPQRTKIFEKGKKIHALASYFLKGFDIRKMEAILTPDEKAIWENLKNKPYFKYEIVGAEYNLSCKIDNYWIGGRLDALVKNNKEYYILDYKTGQIPPNAEFDFQTMVYLLSVDKFLSKQKGYESLKFVYLGLKTNSEKEINLTEELKKSYEEKIRLACKEIEKSIKTNKYTRNCQNCSTCEYKKLETDAQVSKI